MGACYAFVLGFTPGRTVATVYTGFSRAPEPAVQPHGTARFAASMPSIDRTTGDELAASRTPSARGRLAPRLLLSVATLALTLLGLEGVARVYALATDQERGMTFDPELGWRPLPLVRKFGGTWGATRPASTNSHGWRDPERTYAKPPGLRRAVAIGDSFTFGTDADDGERFTDVLPRLVDRLEVVNVGVPGYGTDQELRVLETEGFRYQPDVVVLTVCVYNDLNDIGYERNYGFPKPSYRLDGGRLRLSKPGLTWDIRARRSSYLIEFLFQRLGGDYDKRVAGFTPEHALPLFNAILGRMAAVTAERRVPLVAVLAYAPEEFGDFSDLGRQITASLDRAGVPSLDTRALFAARSSSPSQSFHSSVDSHWNPQGNAIVAEGVRDLLAKVGLQ